MGNLRLREVKYTRQPRFKVPTLPAPHELQKSSLTHTGQCTAPAFSSQTRPVCRQKPGSEAQGSAFRVHLLYRHASHCTWMSHFWTSLWVFWQHWAQRQAAWWKHPSAAASLAGTESQPYRKSMKVTDSHWACERDEPNESRTAGMVFHCALLIYQAAVCCGSSGVRCQFLLEKAPVSLESAVPVISSEPRVAPDSSAPSTKNRYDSDRNKPGARNEEPDRSRCAISEILQTLQLDSCDTLRSRFFPFKRTRCGVAERWRLEVWHLVSKINGYLSPI